MPITKNFLVAIKLKYMYVLKKIIRLTPKNNDRNPWFTQYWEQLFDCTFGRENSTTPERKPICDQSLKLSIENGNVLFLVYLTTMFGLLFYVYAINYSKQ